LEALDGCVCVPNEVQDNVVNLHSKIPSKR